MIHIETLHKQERMLRDIIKSNLPISLPRMAMLADVHILGEIG